jgi:hypothetical protein
VHSLNIVSFKFSLLSKCMSLLEMPLYSFIRSVISFGGINNFVWFNLAWLGVALCDVHANHNWWDELNFGAIVFVYLVHVWAILWLVYVYVFRNKNSWNKSRSIKWIKGKPISFVCNSNFKCMNLTKTHPKQHHYLGEVK